MPEVLSITVVSASGGTKLTLHVNCCRESTDRPFLVTLCSRV
jgi:hypothetical protein